MPEFIYQQPDDNLIGAATITSSGTQTAYPVASLKDLNPGEPSKLSTTSGSFTFQYGSPTPLQFVALIHTNLTPGLTNIQFMGNATNSWGAPSMSANIVISNLYGDGFPRNPWIDLRNKAGYNPAGYLWYRLSFGTANATNISIGELWLGSTYRTLPYSMNRESEPTRERATSVDETDGFAHLGYDLGTTRRRLSCSFQYKDTSKTAIDNWLDSTKGNLRPFIIVPWSDENDAWLVKNEESSLTHTRTTPYKFDREMSFVEIGRGVTT